MKLPPPFSWLWKGWMAFSHVLGRIMSCIILTVLWVIGFGIYAIVLKLKNLIVRTHEPATYWEDAPSEIPDSLKYQF